MPKQVFKILSFHGGINDSSDPRDISDNQFVALENVAIDKAVALSPSEWDDLIWTSIKKAIYKVAGK